MAPMLTLCVCSPEGGAGKTAVAVGLGTRLQRDRFRVEYLQSVTLAPSAEEAHADVAFVRRALHLPQSTNTTFPISIKKVIETDEKDAHYAEQLVRLQEELAVDHDALLVESGPTMLDGVLIGLNPAEMVIKLKARTIIVARYTGDSLVESVLAARWAVGSLAVGVVITNIPVMRMEYTKTTLRPALERRGVRVLGMFPADRHLTAVTVGELVTKLGGTYVTGSERQGELVERLMVGAMNAEHATDFFMRHSNKAVITGGDRPEIQLAALDTPTRCLILTGEFAPEPEVVARAKETGAAIVAVPIDTLTAVERSQEVFADSRFRQDKKVARLVEQFDRNFDMAALYSALELRQPSGRG